MLVYYRTLCINGHPIPMTIRGLTFTKISEKLVKNQGSVPNWLDSIFPISMTDGLFDLIPREGERFLISCIF